MMADALLRSIRFLAPDRHRSDAHRAPHCNVSSRDRSGPLAAEFSADGLRYYLLRHIRPIEDGDFSCERLRCAYSSDVAGQRDNLAHQALSMIERYCDGIVPTPPAGVAEDDRLLRGAVRLPETVFRHLRADAFDRALDVIWAFIAGANRYVAEEAPWRLANNAAEFSDAKDIATWTGRLNGCLFSLAVAPRQIVECLAPLLPAACRSLTEKLAAARCCNLPPTAAALAGSRVRTGLALFPRRDRHARETG